MRQPCDGSKTTTTFICRIRTFTSTTDAPIIARNPLPSCCTLTPATEPVQTSTLPTCERQTVVYAPLLLLLGTFADLGVVRTAQPIVTAATDKHSGGQDKERESPHA